jgi:riboflavin kinase/FMN adenylyltransferase
LIIPKNGIYAVKVYVKNKVYYGATNIGYNPTVNGKVLSIETNIIDFDEEIYGEIIRVEFLDRIRDEKKFNSLDELKSQLRKDVNFVYKKYVYK